MEDGLCTTLSTGRGLWNGSYWRAWLFQVLCLSDATELLHQYDTGIEGFVSHFHVMKSGFSNLNLNPGSSWWNGAKWHPQGKAGKVMAAVLWDEKGVIVMNFLPRGQLWTLDACLYRVGATSQMSELLLLGDSARSQYNMHTNWSHHRLWMDIAAAPTLQSWPLTINLSPVSSFERQPAKTPLHWWPEIGKNYVALSAEDRGHLIPGIDRKSVV